MIYRTVFLVATLMFLLGCYQSSPYPLINEEDIGCDDGFQDGDETGIDCGGSCQPCESHPKPDTYDWNNCGQPATFPGLACQIDTSGDMLQYDVQLIPDVDHIKITIDPRDGHYRLPENMPRVWLEFEDPDTGDDVVASSYEDTTELSNYDKPHSLYLPATMEAGVGATYKICVVGEHGKYSLNGLVVRRPEVVAAP